ncbi:SCO2521 family protein [Nocardia sp. NPDC048505]|uniref:SCO2521 family protein n=1 Tax=unclassified Nocardia TaxID=2637762 RepID=UPI0033C9913F
MPQPWFPAARPVSVDRSSPALRVQRRARRVRLLTRSAGSQPRTPAPEGPLIEFGEVVTALLPNSTVMHRDSLNELLGLMSDLGIAWRERPIPLATSPDITEGVDCLLVTPRRSEMRAIGTVALRAVVYGGRVLQSSAQTRVVRAESDKRRPWEHYLDHHGVLEVVSKVTPTTSDELVAGFLSNDSMPDSLNLKAICDRLLGRIRMNKQLDQRVPLRTRPTRMRWAARIGRPGQPRLVFKLGADRVRTVLISVRNEAELDQVPRFCEDLGVHDWLLTLGSAALADTDIAAPDQQQHIDVLAPTLTQLAHLWMPGAHTPTDLLDLWSSLQERPGFTREWHAIVDQLRDRLSLAVFESLRENMIRSV